MVSREKILEIYERIFLIRTAEERICSEYGKDEMKTPVHLGIGAEGIEAGTLAALSPQVKIFGSYRNHGLYLARTLDPLSFFAELFGKVTGCASGKAGSMHLSSPEHGLWLTSAVVGTPIPAAVGAALAHCYRGETVPVAVFFGDGAVEEGVFWESLNFACLKRLRVFFICEDNGLAIHAPGRDRQGFCSIPEAVSGFKCHVISGEGYDPLSVYAAVVGALEKTESNPKPVFFHFRYFRFKEHVGVHEDFHAGYREAPDPEKLSAMDPLIQIKKAALAQGVEGGEISRLEERIERSIGETLKAARESPFPSPESLYDGV